MIVSNCRWASDIPPEVFNILGPLTNPAKPDCMVCGAEHLERWRRGAPTRVFVISKVKQTLEGFQDCPDNGIRTNGMIVAKAAATATGIWVQLVIHPWTDIKSIKTIQKPDFEGFDCQERQSSWQLPVEGSASHASRNTKPRCLHRQPWSTFRGSLQTFGFRTSARRKKRVISPSFLCGLRGMKRALVVHGCEGLDELSIAGKSKVGWKAWQHGYFFMAK